MSVALALIASFHHLEDFSIYGDCYMALAQFVRENSVYATFHREKAESGALVILDNGAFELHGSVGIGLGPGPVFEAAKLIGATEVVCQDAPLDGPRTVELTRAFLDAARELGHMETYQFMAVPQGRTKDEWLECYEQLASMDGIATIGLSKISVPVAWSKELTEARVECVEELESRGCKHVLHLLGGSRSLPRELAYQHGSTLVRSNDSSFAFWYGYHGIEVRRDTLGAETELGPPDLEHAKLDSHVRWMAALRNVILLHQCGKGVCMR